MTSDRRITPYIALLSVIMYDINITNDDQYNNMISFCYQ